jgi:hypothetical protein
MEYSKQFGRLALRDFYGKLVETGSKNIIDFQVNRGV